MSGNVFQKRWAIFAFGFLTGVLLLVACASGAQPQGVNLGNTAGEAAEEVGIQPEEPAVQEPAQEPSEAPADAPTDAPAEAPAQQPTSGTSLLQEVQQRGVLRCGVNAALPGFGSIDADGNNVGFDVDFCRAIAAAIFGDADAVEYTALNADQRFPALQGGEVDVLIRNTTWSLTRDADLGVDFTVTTFYDGQGYIVRAGEFSSVEELDGGVVCVTSGTTTELNLADDFARRGLTYTANVFSETADAFGTFVEGACDAYTSDKSQLASLRSAEPNPDDYVILPDTISKEPLGPVVRANDSDWRDVVMWTVFAMIEAERLGVNQANVDEMLDSDNIDVQRLLGTGEDDLGALLGLPKDFGYQIISQVGNYADVYDRHLTPIGIEREGTLNAHWTEGGLMYAPAFR
ncbi:MAG TPA: transporter substrate-binding domain-containing protein [Aggregatilineales bacterium]|nr:transporter substrate-binding domain-containing protein [Chloroflexota bacterium]HOA25064.1 transporter substrate-binding domain-containing protein [Aggregatilineales bacterium]HPV06334.1 transporter substrate-binding domain-containing protein [Aggregatilineales bacterium]HQA67774.1 transporter substrate-binding domain-containing protein [Aggregatilineales bacterium]